MAHRSSASAYPGRLETRRLSRVRRRLRTFAHGMLPFATTSASRQDRDLRAIEKQGILMRAPSVAGCAWELE